MEQVRVGGGGVVPPVDKVEVSKQKVVVELVILADEAELCFAVSGRACAHARGEIDVVYREREEGILTLGGEVKSLGVTPGNEGCLGGLDVVELGDAVVHEDKGARGVPVEVVVVNGVVWEGALEGGVVVRR